MKKEHFATLTLPSETCRALWEHELTGQLSDGMWENTSPLNHWEFWCRNTVVEVVEGVGSLKFTSYYRPRKKSYAFNRLTSYVGDRMLAYGKAARAGWQSPLIGEAHNMPATRDEYDRARTAQSLPSWAPNLHKLTSEQVDAFYAASYTKKELRSDLKAINSAMKNIVE